MPSNTAPVHSDNVAADDVPASLRAWFFAHFLVDVVFGVPALLVPEWLLPRFGWTSVDPVAARLVGAALIAIGVQSFRIRAQSRAVYRAFLGLKIIWSASAILGLVIAIGAGGPAATWALLALFIGFSGVWSHYAIRLRQMDSLSTTFPDDDERADADGVANS